MYSVYYTIYMYHFQTRNFFIAIVYYYALALKSHLRVSILEEYYVSPQNMMFALMALSGVNPINLSHGSIYKSHES